jgi:hypothetical protein
VTVVNRTYQAFSNLTVHADVYGIDSKLLHHQTASVSLSATDVKEPFSLAKILTNAKGVNFVVLNLKDATGKVVSHNVYWLAADNDYKALNSMSKVKVQTTIVKTDQGKTETKWTLKFTNNSGQLAFFVHPQLVNDGEEILPCFWSANYFSLAPGESITVTASVSSSQLKSKNQEIQMDGWNIEKQRISLK